LGERKAGPVSQFGGPASCVRGLSRTRSSWLWGVWGAVLAVPMLVVFKTVADHIEDLKPLSELLGE
jgi:hypothetical protein